MVPKNLQVLDSYRKMGLNWESGKDFNRHLEEADKKRLMAMDTNKSKGMSQKEKEFYLNQPQELLHSIGGWQPGMEMRR
jgi:hypothetical protein